MTEDDDVIFREVQWLRPWWLWLLLVGLVVVAVAKLAGLLVPGLTREEGTAPSSGEIWRAILAVIVLATFLAYLYVPRLTTEVGRGRLCVRFFPRHLSFLRIPLDDVIRCEAVTYRPVQDYGGWGIKGGRGSRAYNASGNRGVRLDYADGTHLLIGSQRPDELAHTINQLL